MDYYPGFDISFDSATHEFTYGKGVYGPKSELRLLDDIRPSLKDPACSGPEVLYSIAMDVGREADRDMIVERNLLFGVVWYSSGSMGEEPVRSQGHIHAVSPSCSDSTCEVYEIWDGEACIYMQQFSGDDAGRCIAVHAKAGDVVVVPPGWVHATINAKPDSNMIFGAWCVRDYGFEYQNVRDHGGIAYFPVLRDGGLYWKTNERYLSSVFCECAAREYPELGIEAGVPIYSQFCSDPDKFLFVSNPQIAQDVWERA